MISSFGIASTPSLVFGDGKIAGLPSIVKSYGSKVLVITGARSFSSTPIGETLSQELLSSGVTAQYYKVTSEPTPEMIDAAVKESSAFSPDVVVAIGGGSVLDAGKAISAMLPLNEPVKNYLEGVGTKTHPGLKIPFVAVPTTSGTGSEATKNAVLSEVGSAGFKKSLRHNNFVPDVALIDPALTVSCPPSITAASGMDAFTQLLESYLSTAANPLTDSLAIEGLTRISRSLHKAYREGGNLEARTDMSMAAYLSGVTLANAGLGLVHGFASSIGGHFNIPHGVICSSAMFAANKVTVRKLIKEENESALWRYAQVGRIFSREQDKPDLYCVNFLLDLIEAYQSDFKIPGLGAAGVTSVDLARIADITENKNNPVALNKEEMIEVLEMSL